MAEKNVTPHTRPSEEIRDRNDFRIKDLRLISYNGKPYDLRNVRVTLKLYENIFRTFISGTLVLHDTIDLPQLYPIIGEETLIVSITRPKLPPATGFEDPYKMKFRVYSVKNRRMEKENAQSYSLHFCSPELIHQNKKRIRKSYMKMRYSKMAAKIYDKFIKVEKPIEIETTKFEHDFVVANRNPFTTMNMLASRSESDKGNGWCYLFYEDMKKFNFVSLGKLIEGPVVETFNFGNKNTEELLTPEGTSEVDKHWKRELRNVEEYKFIENFDIMENLTKGMYASRLWTYDTVRQIWEDEIDFDYEEEFDRFKHLAKEKTFTPDLDAKGSPLSHIRLMHTNLDHDKVPWIVAHEPGILPEHLENYVQRRSSQLGQINNAKIKLSVSGDPRIRVGQIIKFNLPQMRGMTDTSKPKEMDRYFQGKWLIVAISHTLEQDSYWIDIEIVKDTFVKKILHIDPIKEVEPSIVREKETGSY